MEEASFSEDTTSEQQECLPFGRDFSQIKIYNGYKFTSKNDILDVSYQIMSTVDDPEKKATYKEICTNADMAKTLDKMTETVVNKNHDKEKQSSISLDIPAHERDSSKSNLSNILLHHLSKEEFLKGQGINCETFPDISNADHSDEAIIRNIILCYAKNSCPKEQTLELTGPLSSKRDGENSNKHCGSRTMREEITSDLEEPVVAGESSYQGTSHFLTKIKSPHDKPKSFQGQPPQKQQTEKAISGNGFKYGHGQVLEKLQGHLELLEQEFQDNKEKHLTLKQVHRHESPAVGDFDPERKEIMEKQGHRRPSYGRCPTAIREKAPHADSILGSDTGHSCYFAPKTGLSSDKCQNCGTMSHNSRKACGKKTTEEFHYRYNTPGENYITHSERSDFVQICFLNENKNSSPSCSKPEWICSQTSNPKSSQDEHESIPGKKNLKIFMTYSSDLATPTPYFQPFRISGSKSLSNLDSMETESEILNSSLDHALRTATILKETTDQMIRSIAEDLAKVQRWRNQLKY
uniref:AKNA domain-containing protein n=1 Tax=Suricata suricatta TaxID=37032 RepID=A0A673TMB0_SURSU